MGELVDIGSPGNFTTGVTVSDKLVNYATKKGNRNATKFEGHKSNRDMKISRNINIIDYGIIKDWNPMIQYSGTFFDSLIHERTARITLSAVKLWETSWIALEHEPNNLPEENDNSIILDDLKSEWEETRNTFRYFPIEVTKCVCDSYHANISEVMPRNEDTRGTEHAAIVMLVYNENTCLHCRAALEIYNQNNKLSDTVKSKLLLCARNIDKDGNHIDVNLSNDFNTQVMALVGTYQCYRTKSRAVYTDWNENGFKLRMIKNNIQTMLFRVVMHREEELEAKKLWTDIRTWFKYNRNRGEVNQFNMLYPKTYEYMKKIESQKSTKLSMESLKKVGECINRCKSQKNYIATPDNDIIEYLHLNTGKVGAYYFADIRKGSMYENDFENEDVEEEMFGRPMITSEQANNRAHEFWCDKCSKFYSKSNINRHITENHDKKTVTKKDLMPKSLSTIQRAIREAIVTGYYVYCPVCNGTYTTDQYEKIHIHSKSHIENDGRDYSRDNQAEDRPIIKWKISPELKKALKKMSSVSSDLKWYRNKLRKSSPVKDENDEGDEKVATPNEDMAAKEGNKIRECHVSIERITKAAVTMTTSTTTTAPNLVSSTKPAMKTAAPLVSRTLRNTSNNENIGTVQNEDKTPDDGEMLDYEAETEVDRPNNCYTIEGFCDNNPTLQSIIEKAIVEHRNENKPFQIDHPFLGRLDDNFRVVNKLGIPVVLHSMQDKNTENEPDKDCELLINASQDLEDADDVERPIDQNGEEMETNENTTVEITPQTKTDTKKN